MLRRALPNALAVVCTVMAAYIWTPWLGFTADQTTLLMYLLVGTVGCMAVCKACYPFNVLRLFLTCTVPIGYFAAVIIFHGMLDLTALSAVLYQPWAILAACALILERIFSKCLANVSFKHL